ncbi:hypothetical protein FHS83_001185 [Rhizomicrobium palustre]|uniref:STAS/SEC14 domain-containing protein n=1 Tax=Rhizomicrobium palustre TaxID=189966 RepID=A0A846MY15_9PROT|nr:hypothetical protein [Rhizomicrobium palustre]NIK87867.1 hypothetical protein [Rhizomicrobium palustre]
MAERITKETFAARYPGAKIVVRERAGGVAFLALSPGRVVLRMEGSIHFEHLIGVLRDGQPKETLASDQFNALIDFSAFTGEIDWNAIRDIREIMPKGDSRTNKNAYVVRNDYYALTADVTRAIFAQTECRAFKCEEDALAWLGWS